MAETKFAGRGLHELQILLYVCSLLKVARPHIRNPLAYAATAARQSCAKLSLKGQKLSLKSFQSKVRPNGCEYDFNAVVFISPKTAVYLSVRNCQWVNAKCYVRNSEEDSPYLGQVASISHRWIVLHISPDIPDDHCLVSPILYHNLAKNKQGLDVMIEFTNDFQFVMSSAFQKIVVLWHNAHSTEPSPEKDVNFQNGPQYASEVEVKYVESIKYKCGSQLEPLINDYFSEPKAVNIDDVLVIPLPSHLAYEFANSNCVLPPNYIFIKVCSVKRKAGAVTRQTMLVKKGVTSLYLSGTTQCPLPTLSQNINQVGKMDVPPVLANNCKKLKSLMEMEIKGSQQGSCDCDVDMQVCGDCKEKDIVTEPCTPKEDAAKDSIRVLSNLGQDYTECEDVMASASVLFLGPPGSGIEEVVNLAASDLGLEVLWIECWHLKGDTSGATEARVRQTFLRASSNSPCVLALRNVHCIAKDHDGNDDGRVVAALREEMTKLQHSSVILIATAPDRSHVSADLWSVWSHQETVQAPDILQRSLMLEWLFSMWVPKAKLHTLAQRTAGYIFGDFQALFNAAQRLCLYQLFLHQEIETKDNTRSKIPSLTYEDLLNALDELQSNRSEALGAPRIPQVRWKEVGGLEEAKREVVNTIQLPLRHPSLVSNGLRRSGVLLYGPPGTGKTLLAKAVATECGLNFMSVKGPELLNMYVGQSEENVRQVFARARAAAPCVIFFDELDSLAPNRGRSGDSGGVMDRIVSALLAELDGVASAADVFVLAATNRPDLIDPALLRPGRFEKLVFLGVCEDRASQVKILQAVTSKVPLAEDVSLERVATVLPLTLTGADLYALCTDALYTALQRTTQDIVEGKVKEEEAEILVREDDFKTAADQLVPSVTPRELLHYRNMNTNKR